MFQIIISTKIIKKHKDEKEGFRIRNAQQSELEECLSLWHLQMINSLVLFLCLMICL